MKISLAYGSGLLEVELPDHATSVIEPAPQHGIANEREGLLAALESPVGAAPLREQLAGPGSGAICIVFTDFTRALRHRHYHQQRLSPQSERMASVAFASKREML
jgi:hypothetical protein